MNGRHPNICVRRTDKAPIVGLLRSIHDAPVGQTCVDRVLPWSLVYILQIVSYVVSYVLLSTWNCSCTSRVLTPTLGTDFSHFHNRS